MDSKRRVPITLEFGSKLPGQFRPWHAVGVVAAGKALPHKFSRAAIEDAIGVQGFSVVAL
jgi:hypothetical protein